MERKENSLAKQSDELWEWLRRWPTIFDQVHDLVTALKRRQIKGSSLVARAVGKVLRNLVGSCRVGTAGDMVNKLRDIGHQLMAAQPLELVTGNIVRRVLYIIREHARKAARGEYEEDGEDLLEAHSPLIASIEAAQGKSMLPESDSDSSDDERTSGPSSSPTLSARRSSVNSKASGPVELTEDGLNIPFKSILRSVMDHIKDVLDELKNITGPIADQAATHIHANERILTYGQSRTVANFLQAAAKAGRKFEVYVAESAPSLRGHTTAKDLATGENPINVTLISDAAVFAMMARMDKVIIGAHAVIANGGLLVHSGGHALALAAKYHKVPVVCVTGLYKLCPLYPHDQDTFNTLLSPGDVLPASESEKLGEVEVLNPAFDYIPPELVELLITDVQGAQPSYVYRLLSESYALEDYLL